MKIYTGKTIKPKEKNGMPLMETIESKYNIKDEVYYFLDGPEEWLKYKIREVCYYEGLQEFSYWIKPINHKYKIGYDVMEDELYKNLK